MTPHPASGPFAWRICGRSRARSRICRSRILATSSRRMPTLPDAGPVLAPRLAFEIDEYQQRLARVLEAMDGRGLEALIAYGIQFTLPGHVTWLAGGEPRLGLTKAAMAVVLPRSARP